MANGTESESVDSDGEMIRPLTTPVTITIATNQ